MPNKYNIRHSKLSTITMRKKIMPETKIEKTGKLPFAKNEVYRLMKENLDDDKMIKARVKEEMNKFLYSILKNVCKQLNEYPYTTVDYGMFKECIYPYTNIEKINQEKERILIHLDAIKADCDALAMDVEKSLRVKDTVEDDFIADFSGDNKEHL